MTRTLRLSCAVCALALAACPRPPVPLPRPEPAFDPEIARLEDVREPGARRLSAIAAEPDPARRARALRALAHLQDPAGLPAMAAALGDADARVRAEGAFAIEALGLSWKPIPEKTRIDAENAVLGALAKKPPDGEAAGLWRALGSVASAASARSLAVALGEPGAKAAEAAGLALGGFCHRGKKGWPEGAPLPDRILDRPEPEVRRAALYALFRAAAAAAPGPALLELLGKGLRDRDDEARALASKGLAAAKDAGRAEALALAAMNDADWRVRVEAMRALAATASAPTPAAGFHTAVALASERAAERVAPANAMPLLAAFQSPAPKPVMARAAEVALGRLARAREGATAAARADLARLECAAAFALDRAREKPDEIRRCGGDTFSTKERDRLRARLLGEVPRSAARGEELLRLARAADAGTRALAVESLGKLGGDDARAAIREALADRDGPVVANAADAAAAQKDSAAVPALLDALARFAAPTDAEVQQSVAAALGALKAGAAEKPLRALLSAPTAAVRQAAGEALAALGVKAEEAPPALAASESLAPPHEATLRLRTSKGEVVIVLARDDAPANTRAIAELARKGFYDGLTFHRVVPDFVAQGGDPRGDGWGGPGFTLRCEVSPRPYARGTVGMALAGKDTGGSQLFVVHSMQPHLAGKYTVIGEVVSGMEAIDRILEGDVIEKASLE